MKKNVVLFILVILATAGISRAQAPHWQWAVQASTTGFGSVYPQHICSDNSSNIYGCGVLSGHLSIADSKLSVDTAGGPKQGAFIAKFDKDGKALFTFEVIDDFQPFWNLATDSSGNSYVCGTCTTPADLGGGFSITTGPYIIKLNTDGRIQWVKNFPTRRNGASLNAIASSKYGSMFITGYFRDTLNIQGKIVTSHGLNSYAVFVAELNSAGDVLWLKKAGGSGNYCFDEGTALAIADDPENPALYVAGTARDDSAFFDNTLLLGRDSALYTQSNSSRGGAFIAKYSGASGAIAWVIGSDSRRGNLIDAAPSGICTDHLGNIYFAGGFDADSGFFGDPSVHTIRKVNWDQNAFLVKLDKNGSIQWLRVNTTANYTNFENVTGLSLCMDDKGNAYTSGMFEGLTNFNGSLVEIDTPGFFHGYLMKFRPDGSEEWWLPTDEGATLQLVFTNQSLYASGYFNDSLRLDTSLLINNNFINTGFDFFLAKLGNTTSSVNAESPAHQNSFALFPNPASRSVNIHFTLATPGNLTIEIFDLLGRKVNWIFDRMETVGEHNEILELPELPNGSYLCRMRSADCISEVMFSIVK